jgi:hypothetical protein
VQGWKERVAEDGWEDTGGEEGSAPQARKLGKSQGRGCAWCAGRPEGASSGSSCALPFGRAIGGAFPTLQYMSRGNAGDSLSSGASRAEPPPPPMRCQSFHIHTETRVPRWWAPWCVVAPRRRLRCCCCYRAVRGWSGREDCWSPAAAGRTSRARARPAVVQAPGATRTKVALGSTKCRDTT